ncbi:MAG TPA: hypothetical protein VN366_00365 [Feifaniaceae bacterium]|nr:hypothetical protein [Feifaniaceae bacterium]
MNASDHPAGYVEQKQGLLEHMLSLVKAQLSCLTEDREEDLAAVLEESETLRAKIDALDAGQGPKTLTKEMRETLEEIGRLDEQCTAFVKERLLFYRAELKSIRQSGKNMQQYVNPYTAADGLFIDTRK